MTPPLLSLPISFITAAVSLAMAVLILKSRAGNPTSRACFALLFGVFALQATLVGLRFGYGLEGGAAFQRALPFAVGPLAYFGFRAMAQADLLKGRTIRFHAGAALLAVVFCWLVPFVLKAEELPALALSIVDLLIGLSFVIYLGLLVTLHRRGPDVFEPAGFEEIARLRAWLLAAIFVLAGIVVVDSAIALDFAVSSGRHASDLIALSSALIIPALLVAVALYPLRTTAQAQIPSTENQMSEADVEADRALIDKIDALLTHRRLHRDPDLSLTRLARRLGVPARRVSEAVNRQLGRNVSQFVNHRRVTEAARLLVSTDRPVAEIMIEAGFRTKSNFNREFRRVTGHTPLDYRQQRRIVPPSMSSAATPS